MIKYAFYILKFTVTLIGFTYAIWAVVIFHQYSCKVPKQWSQKRLKRVGEFLYTR
jgi:hypothetical protein